MEVTVNKPEFIEVADMKGRQKINENNTLLHGNDLELKEKILEIKTLQEQLEQKIAELDFSLTGSINGVKWDGKTDITVTAKANGGHADTATNATTAEEANSAANAGNASTVGGFPVTKLLTDYGINTKNADEKATYIASDSIGDKNFPQSWTRVVSFYDGHFCTQLGMNCTSSTDTSRESKLWVRDAYGAGSFSRWSKIPVGWISKSTATPTGGSHGDVWLQYT